MCEKFWTLSDETWAAHTPAGPRLFPSMLRSMFPEKLPAFRTGEPSDSQGRFLLKKKQPLCVRPAHRQKGCFFLQRVRDVSPDVPGAVFSLELVAYLERAAYAFPRPRIAGGAKQEGDWNLF